MRTVYATRFRVTPKAGDAGACIEELKGVTGRWVSTKYERTWNSKLEVPFDNTPTSPFANHTVVGQHQRMDGADLISLDWSHPHDLDPSFQWVTSLTIAQSGGQIELSAVLRIEATQFLIKPFAFDIGTPRLLIDVLNGYECAIDDAPIPRSLRRLSAAQVAAFADDQLFSPKRNLPIVMISPDSWKCAYALDATDLARRLLGFAQIAVLTDKWAAFKLTDVVGRDHTCFDGAVRLYWPGFQTSDSRFLHKLYMPQSIRLWEETTAPLAKRLFRHLCSIACFRFADGPVTREARHAVTVGDRAELERMRAAVKAGEIDKDKLEGELLDAWERSEALSDQNTRLRADLEQQRANWAAYREFEGDVDDEAVPEDAPPPTGFASVSDAYLTAATKFPGPLVFLASAAKAAKDSPFRNGDRVYQLLEAIYEIAKRWKEGNGRLGTSWEAAFQEKGFDYKDKISSTDANHVSEGLHISICRCEYPDATARHDRVWRSESLFVDSLASRRQAARLGHRALRCSFAQHDNVSQRSRRAA